jgi:hypothetical protein
MKKFIPPIPQTEEVKLLEQKQDEQEKINQLEEEFLLIFPQFPNITESGSGKALLCRKAKRLRKSFTIRKQVCLTNKNELNITSLY